MTCQNADATCEACGRRVCSRCARCYERLPGRAPGTWRQRCPSRWCRYIKFLTRVVR